MAKHLPPDYDRRLFYFELMGGTHEDDSGFYQTGDLVVSQYDLAGRHGKDKFRPIPFPPEPVQADAGSDTESDIPRDAAQSVEELAGLAREPAGPVQGSDDDGLGRLSLRELRELAAESQIELPVEANKAEVVARIRQAWDDA